jgi:hypothetical protein
LSVTPRRRGEPARAARRAARIGIGIAAAGFGVCIVSVFLALPPLSFGIWNQVEPVFVANYIGGGMIALGLVPLAWHYGALRRRMVHPFVLLPLGLAAWSLIGSFFQELPRITIFGSPELGEGVLWYLELAVLIAGGLVLKRFRRARTLLIAAAAFTTVTVSVAMAVSFHVAPFPWIPYFFTDYLAFYAVFLAAALFALARHRSAATAVAIGAAVAILVLSNNFAAMAAGFVLAPAAWWILSRPGLRGVPARALGASAIAGLLVLGTIVEWKIDFERLAEVEGKIGSLANSVVSRHHLLKMASDAIADDPTILAVGSGWGTFSDHFAVHLPVDWVRTRDDPEASAIFGTDGVWDATHRVDFHSHNAVTEATLGAGLPGAALLIALFAALPVWAGRRRVPLGGALGAAVGGISIFWFQLPASLSMMALSWAAVGGPPPRWSRRMDWRVGLTALLLAAGLLLAERGLSAYRFAHYAFFYAPSLTAAEDRRGGIGECPFAFEDEGRGGFHLSHRLRAVTYFVVSRLRDGLPVSDELVGHLRGIFCASEQFIGRYPTSIRLEIASIASRADLAFAPPDPRIQGIYTDYAPAWRERLDAVLAKAPRRTDLAAPYLLMLLRDGLELDYQEFSGELYRRNPADPVAQWFSGIALLGDPATAGAGAARMADALRGGVERMIPVDSEIKAQIVGVEDPAN